MTMPTEDQCEILRGSPLTEREHRVLCLRAGGYFVKEVMAALGLTESTINMASRNAQCKLGGNNYLHTVTLALRKGVVTWEEIDTTSSENASTRRVPADESATP